MYRGQSREGLSAKGITENRLPLSQITPFRGRPRHKSEQRFQQKSGKWRKLKVRNQQRHA
jgi:hypothetical protein